MYAILQFTKPSLTVAEMALVAEAVTRIACGSNLADVHEALGYASWFNPNNSIVTDNEADRWTRGETSITSPCASPNESKLKHVSFSGTVANRLTMSFGDGVVSQSQALDLNSTSNARIYVRVCPRSIFVGTYSYTVAKTLGGLMVCSEFNVSGTASHYAAPGLLPLCSFQFTLADLSHTNSLNNSFSLFNTLNATDTIVNAFQATPILNDVSGNTNWANVRNTHGVPATYNGDDPVDALLPIGITNAAPTNTHSFCASLSDLCGIYFHQTYGQLDFIYSPEDVIELEGINYVFFNKFAIPLA